MYKAGTNITQAVRLTKGEAQHSARGGLGISGSMIRYPNHHLAMADGALPDGLVVCWVMLDILIVLGCLVCPRCPRRASVSFRKLGCHHLLNRLEKRVSCLATASPCFIVEHQLISVAPADRSQVSNYFPLSMVEDCRVAFAEVVQRQMVPASS